MPIIAARHAESRIASSKIGMCHLRSAGPAWCAALLPRLAATPGFGQAGYYRVDSGKLYRSIELIRVVCWLNEPYPTV